MPRLLMLVYRCARCAFVYSDRSFGPMDARCPKCDKCNPPTLTGA